MSRITATVLALSIGALAGCGGGGDDAGKASPSAIISAENTLAYGQEATVSLNGMAGAGEALSEVISQLSMITTGSADGAMRRKPTTAAANETVECAGGGTVTIESSGSSSQEQTVRFVADQCIDGAGAMLHGELLAVIGQWDEFANREVPGVEMTLETGAGGFASDTCDFNGGLVLRVYAEQAADPYGENRFVFEYGTTDAGFIAFCEPDREINLAADTLLRNEFIFAQAEDGSMTSSNTVNIHGGFEAPDGSGYVTLVAEDLEYAVSDSGESQYGAAMSCPVSGRISITGGEQSTASIYFGDDAPAPYAVQVRGPDGFLAEFETCEAFLAAAQ